MHFTRFWSIVEATHDISNPCTPQKLDRLIDLMGFHADQHILDIGSGRGWLDIRIAERTGARITAIEINPWFNEVARLRAQRAGVHERIDIIEADGRTVTLTDQTYDAGLCIGASFAVGGLAPLLDTFRRVVKPGGLIAVGDIFRITDTLPAALDELGPVPTLAGLVDQIRGDHEPLEMLVATLEDWDRYETRKWQAAQQWIAANPTDPEHDDLVTGVATMRHDYLHYERPHIGWAIVVARV